MEPLPPIPSPPGAAFREFRISFLPGLVFAAVLCATVITWRQYVGPSQWVGEVEAVRALVTAPQAGEIVELRVGLLQKVSAGETLAVLNPSDPRALAAKLDVSRSRLDLLRESLDARLRQQNNQISLIQLRLDWMSQRAVLGALKARQSFYVSELDRQRQLMNWLHDRAALTATRVAGAPADPKEPAGTTPADKSWILEGADMERVADFQVAKRDLDSLNAEIEERTRLVEETSAAIRGLAPTENQLDVVLPNAVKAAVAFEEEELRQLEMQIKPVALVASMDGVISAIGRRAGENVLAGETLLTISSQRAERVVAFVRQPLNMDVRTNMAVEIRSRAGHHESGLGRVVAVGSQMELIYPQLLPRGTSNKDVEYGLPVLVSVPAGLRVIGGEVVDLYPASN